MIIPTDRRLQCFNNGTNQAHVCLGFAGYPFAHPDRFALLALHTYLGGGMSSVLFQKIREERGMAYTVFSYTDFYRDSGIFGIYLATDRVRVSNAVEIILRELGRVKKKKLSDEKLAMVKAQIKGNLTLGMESTSGRMNRLGRYELMAGKHVSLRDALIAVERVTSERIVRVARELINTEQVTVTSLGPVVKKDLQSVNWALA